MFLLRPLKSGLATSSTSSQVAASTSRLGRQEALAVRRSQFISQFHSTRNAKQDVHSQDVDPSFVDLLTEPDAKAPPDLAALDDLDPRNAKHRRRRFGPLDAGQRWTAWASVIGKVKKSFTGVQLQSLVREAEVPASVITQQAQLIRQSRSNKDVLASALLVHRFGMENPKATPLPATPVEELVEVHHQISTPAAYLLFAANAVAFRSVLARHRVRLATPSHSVQKPKAEAKTHTLTFVGHAEAIEAVKQNLDAFVHGIVTTTQTLSSVTSSDSIPVEVPDSAQLEEFSLLSKSRITIDEVNDKNVIMTISSVNSYWSSIASLLLTQLQFDSYQMRTRGHLALTAPPVPHLQQSSFPVYSMQPHVDATSVAIDQSAFRLVRQDVSGLDADVLDWRESTSSTNLPALMVGSRPILQELVKENDEAEFVFERLSDAVSSDQAPQLGPHKETTYGEEAEALHYTAQFGHLLFQHDQPPASDVVGMLNAPLDGMWPVEHGLSWIRRDLLFARQSGAMPVRAPTFVPCVPPSATDISARDDWKGVRPAAMQAQNERHEAGVHDRQNLQFDIQDVVNSMAPQRPIAPTAFLGMLSDEQQYHERLVVRYVCGQDVLEIEVGPAMHSSSDQDALQYEALGLEPKGLEIQQMRIVREAQADVLVPDAPVDIRLTADRSRNVMHDAEMLKHGPEWQEYSDLLATRSLASFTGAGTDVPLPPSHVTLSEGRRYSLLDLHVVTKWTWDILEDPEFNPYRASVVHSLSRNLQTDVVVPALQIRWKAERGGDGAQAQSSAWFYLRRHFGAAFASRYETGTSGGHAR